MAEDVPASGRILSAAAPVDVLVGKFDTVKDAAAKTDILLPDPAETQLPLKMRVPLTGEPGKKRLNMEQLRLFDASGKQVYQGEKENLQNHHVLLVKETDAEGNVVLRMVPVKAFYQFNKQPVGMQHRSAEEQVELFDKLSAIGGKMTAADILRQRKLKAAAEAAEEGRAGGGRVDRGEGDEEEGGAVNYRKAFVTQATAAAAEGGGRALDDEDRLAGGGGAADLDDMYRLIDGGAGGAGEEAGGEGYYDNREQEEAAGRAFDVIGNEEAGEEMAIDVDWAWDDDAGDAGGVEDMELAVKTLNAEEEEAGGTAHSAAYTVEAGVGSVELEDMQGEDAESEQRRLLEMAAGTGAGAGRQAGKSRHRASGGAAGGAAGGAEEEEEEEEGGDGSLSVGAAEAQRTVKKARVDASADPVRAIRERVQSLLTAHGGSFTSKALTSEFKKELKGPAGEAFKQMLTSVVKGMTRQIAAPDGSKTFVQKKD